MNKYKVKYVIHTEFLAENDEAADKIDEKNLNIIFKNGEFYIKRFKLVRKVTEDAANNDNNR